MLKPIPVKFLPRNKKYQKLWRQHMQLNIEYVANDEKAINILSEKFSWNFDDIEKYVGNYGPQYLVNLLTLRQAARKKFIKLGHTIPKKYEYAQMQQFLAKLTAKQESTLINQALNLYLGFKSLDDVAIAGHGPIANTIFIKQHLNGAIFYQWTIEDNVFGKRQKKMLKRHMVRLVYFFVVLNPRRYKKLFPLTSEARNRVLSITMSEAAAQVKLGYTTKLKDITGKNKLSHAANAYVIGCCAELLSAVPKYQTEPIKKMAAAWRKANTSKDIKKAIVQLLKTFTENDRKLLKQAHDSF